MRSHRFALSISGGIALGSYEAGVLCQLYRDLYAFNRLPDIHGQVSVSIDAIAGASAGSITGLILAQALSLGLPPELLETRMRACWIELLSLEQLLKPWDQDSLEGIFTGGVVPEVIRRALEIPPTTPAEFTEPIALWITMTNLDGVPYRIDFGRHDEHHAQAVTELYALDYTDCIPFVVTRGVIAMVEEKLIPRSGSQSDLWQAASDAAHASSAFPVAFPSQWQERDLMQYPGYCDFKSAVEGRRPDPGDPLELAAAVTPLPTRFTFQFIDGGVFHNQPVGKAIDAVTWLDLRFPERLPHTDDNGGAGRSYLIIEPEPQLPESVEQALNLHSEHAARPDLPPAMIGKILGAYFNTALFSDFNEAVKMNGRVAALEAALDELDRLGLSPDHAAAIKEEIRTAAGFRNKRAITLQRIPAEVAKGRRLASSFMGHFGGFLRRDYREADFITGRNEGRMWLVRWLELWLKSHANEIGIAPQAITPDWVLAHLDPQPIPVASDPLPDTGLSPEDLAASGWFASHEPGEPPTAAQWSAALSEAERDAILSRVEERAAVLTEAWTRLPRFVIEAALELFNLHSRHGLLHDPARE